MNREAFEKAIGGKDWASIEDLARVVLDSEDIYPEEDREDAQLRDAKAFVRKYMKATTDANGEPLYHSISQVQPDGSTTRVYKQESLFNGGDYQQVIDYHAGRVDYHAKRCFSMKERGESRGYEPSVPVAFEQLLMQV